MLSNTVLNDSTLNDAIPVTVKSLEQLVFHPVKKAPAQVVTLQNSLLSAEISALVTDVHVQIGDRVVKEQKLISLQCEDYKLNKQQLLAEKDALDADRLFAIYQLERSRKLLKSKSVSEEAHRRLLTGVKKIKAQIQLLESKIKLSEKNISRCEIKAPFSGVIAERLIDLGEYVIPHTPLVRLIDIENLEVEVQVPIVMIDELEYTSLNFLYRNKKYPLTLRAIIPSIETRARHQKVRLNFIDKKTLPDAYGMVEVTLRGQYIPANYLVLRNSQMGIFVLKETQTNKNNEKLFTAWFYPIKNALTGRAALIDLPMATEIIVSGRNALMDGQTVLLQNSIPNSKEKE